MASDERFIQVGWWDKRTNQMRPMFYNGPQAGLTPLYERQWSLDAAQSLTGRPA